MRGIAGEPVQCKYTDEILFLGELPLGMGEPNQLFQGHMGSRNAGQRQDVLDYRTVHTPAQCQGLLDGSI